MHLSTRLYGTVMDDFTKQQCLGDLSLCGVGEVVSHVAYKGKKTGKQQGLL